MQTSINCVDIERSEVMLSGWIYAFGLYHPRWKIARHLNSNWTQAVVLAKRKSEDVIGHFGRIIAQHLEGVLLDDISYAITHVPAEENHELYLFLDFNRCATKILAASIYGNLQNKGNISLETLLFQMKPKAQRQHQCASDAERAANVNGIYAVTNSALVQGKSVILVDDILTSGATMVECAGVLRSAGALSVMGIALARTERANAPRFVFAEDGWIGGEKKNENRPGDYQGHSTKNARL